MSILKCPVCGLGLTVENRALRCGGNHCFDIAKEGYVNLLSGSRAGDKTGDNKEMARSRRDFLNKGFYAPIAGAVCSLVEKYSDEGDSVLDICCGEGYYTDFLTKRLNRDFFGFDLSKSMVRLAAKRKCPARFFVANISSVPVRSGSVRAAFHLFAPFRADEFSRIISGDGVIITAVPGARHLYGLKKVLYDSPYLNDEKPPETDGLRLLEEVRVERTLTFGDRDDILSLFRMTPYYYHTPSRGMARLEALESLTAEIDVLLQVYAK